MGAVSGGSFLDGLLDAAAGAVASPLVLSLFAVIIAAGALGGVLLALVRRGRSNESQEIVRLLEEMRSGSARGRAEVDTRSLFAPIAESANRLAQDLGAYISREETAREGFQALQEAARGYAVITTDADGDLRAVSAGSSALFGWEEDAIVGRNASLLFDDAAWKDLLPKLARRSLRERGIETRALMARRDGTRFHARLHVRMLRGAGEAPGFLLVVQDVSEQVRIETDLRAAESRSRRMLDDLPLAVAVLEKGRVVSVNAAFRALLSLGEADAVGTALIDRIATDDVLLVQDALVRLEASEVKEAAELTVGVSDAAGRRRSEVRLSALAHRAEGRAGVLVMLSDATEEQRMLRALRASENRLDAVLEASDDGVLLLAEEVSGTRVRIANRTILDLLGLNRWDVLGTPETEFLRLVRSRGESGAALAACLAAAEGSPASDTVLWAEPEGRWIELRATPVGSRDAGTAGRLLVARDVTAHRRIERGLGADVDRLRRTQESLEAAHGRLKEAYGELEARRVEAERLNDELRTLDTMKSDLLANVSHELQTPLVSIRGYTEMIVKGRLGPINDEQKQGLTLSLRNIDRLIGMIDNLLSFARMDRESAAMNLSTFPLEAIVAEVVQLLRDRLAERKIELSLRSEQRGLVLHADRDKVYQVFLNVIQNAIKFNREGGSIEIVARRGKPGFALVHVRDTGEGIPKEDLERIFDRFYQAKTSAERASDGTGIGLAIVRNILRLHGCVINASSTVGEGTTISFTLPVAEARGEEAATETERPGGGAPPRTDQGQARPEGGPEPAASPGETPSAAQQAEERRRLRIIRRG